MLTSLTCFLTFYCSAIPTSRHFFNIFFLHVIIVAG